MTTAAEEITARMRGKWRGGAHGYGMFSCPVHGPDKHPSARVRNGETGVPLVSCYLGCDRKDMISELRARGAWPETAIPNKPARSQERRRYVTRRRSPTVARHLTPADENRIAYAKAIWQATVKASGTIVERYWHDTRGLSVPIPRVIRYGAAVPYGYPQHGKQTPPTHPAMVALVQAPDGSGAGIHATFLAADGSDKRKDLPNSRLVYGSVGGCAIRLCDAADEMAIGEGIESTASYSQQFGIASWACLNTSGVRNVILPPPPLAFKVICIGENDENGASRNAINAATARLRLEGRIVESAWPSEEYKDFNDPLRRA